MEQEFIRNLQKQWQAVKASASLECEAKNLPNLAQAYRDCRMFKGDENVEQMAKLLTSVRGSEFCLRYNFPNIATLRRFKPEHPEKYGVYIDGGSVYLKNPTQSPILFAGRVAATIEISDNSKRYEIILMAGAKAVINARNWAVVSVRAGQGCTYIKNATDNAIIL